MVSQSRSVVRSSVVRYLVQSYSQRDSALGPLLRRLPLNATTKQLLSLERHEQRAYLENLWSFNAEQAAAGGEGRTPAGSALYKMHTVLGLVRRFNQLPCTVATRQKRADLLLGENQASHRILVLGDDDLLSVELARRGFQRVTVADCDERLLGRIREETRAFTARPSVLHADFRHGFKALEPADTVFLDPPYSVDGAVAFLRLALAAAAPGARIFLMINQDIIGAAFAEITAEAKRSGFRLVRHQRAFNAYPLSPLEAFFLKMAWRLVMNRRAAPGGVVFCSDCFEFESES